MKGIENEKTVDCQYFAGGGSGGAGCHNLVVEMGQKAEAKTDAACKESGFLFSENRLDSPLKGR